MKTLIIGNGAAGIAVVEAIRKINSDISITITSDEPYLHYARPRVSDVLAGKAAAGQIVIRKREWYDKNGVEIVLSEKVSRLDLPDKKAFSSNGSSFSWDALVLAPGARSFIPPVKGAESEGVFSLRTLEDAASIIGYASGRSDALVLGGGLLGIEAANGLLARGLRVMIVEVMERLLPRQLDTEGAQLLKKMIEEKGIRILTGRKAELIERTREGLRVAIGNGETIDAGFILVSAGVRPRLELSSGTGIATHFGIVIGNRMETNIPCVWACGDACEHNGVLYGIWPAAKEQGDVCGTNIAGEIKEYRGSVMSTRLSVLGVGLASLGSIEPGNDTKIAVWRDSPIYKKLFIKNDRIAGAILLGDTQDYKKFEEAIKTGQKVSDLKDLLTGAEISP